VGGGSTEKELHLKHGRNAMKKELVLQDTEFLAAGGQKKRKAHEKKATGGGQREQGDRSQGSRFFERLTANFTLNTWENWRSLDGRGGDSQVD